MATFLQGARGSRILRILLGSGALTLGILVIRAFFGAGRYYQSYAMPYGSSVAHVHPQEIAFLVVYGLHGALAAALLTTGLILLRGSSPIERVAGWVARRPDLLLVACVATLLISMLALWLVVFQGAPISDDEPTYVFIARTLLEGRVINPLPGDEPFFQNMFLVFNESGWYGKYPIGHPLFLAAGESLGLMPAVTPVLSAATLVLTWFVGARLVGRPAAGLAVVLLLLSPQFVLTGTTLLSQPTSAFIMMLGLLLTLRFEEAPSIPRAAFASAVWSFGVLVRPFPGILFVAVVMVFLLWKLYRERLVTGVRRVGITAAAAVPAAVFAALFLLVNHLQSGNAATTGYHSPETGLQIPNQDGPLLSLSLLGGWLRQNFWLFGWPLSFLFVPFARGRRSLTLLWALLAAVFAYRLIVPKTFISTTGPIYLMEAVPLLALLTGAGVFSLRDWLGRHLPRLRAALAPTLVALVAVSLSMFLPVQLRNIEKSCAAVRTPQTLLEVMPGDGKALVFANWMVPGRGISWSLFPPPPSPTLDDDIIFVRIPTGTEDPGLLVDFWGRRFPTRTAWIYDPHATDGPPLRPLIPHRRGSR